MLMHTQPPKIDRFMVKNEQEGMVLASEVDRKNEFIDTLDAINPKTALQNAPLIFDVLRAWWAEYGESKELMEAACHKLSLDRTAGEIYLRCPEIIPVMERLRNGESIRKLKITMSADGRCWWHALLIMDVLRKSSGVIPHVRLVRWLGHRADAGQVRAALALLRDSGLIETYYVKGNDPVRPVTWHRLLAGSDGGSSSRPCVR
jgi:hypothetical protein